MSCSIRIYDASIGHLKCKSGVKIALIKKLSILLLSSLASHGDFRKSLVKIFIYSLLHEHGAYFYKWASLHNNI